MRVVGHHEQAIARDGHAAVDAARGVADEPPRARPLEPPDLAAVAGVERVALVRAGDVHDAVDDDRRDFEARRTRDGVDPLRRETRDIALGDFGERRVAVAAGRAVIAGPVGLGGHDAIAGAGFFCVGRIPPGARCKAQQQYAAVIGLQLNVVGAVVVDRDAFDSPAVAELVRTPCLAPVRGPVRQAVPPRRWRLPQSEPKKRPSYS